MERQWPPEGHAFVYNVTVDLVDGPTLVHEVSVPGHMPGLHLATLPVGRVGGATPDDLEYRRRLFGAIGAITVAGGHVESACKRLLLAYRGAGGFSAVDKTWTDLHKMLRREASSAKTGREGLAAVLKWGEDEKVKWHRDNAAHSYWWLYDAGPAMASRFFHKEDGANIVSSLEQLESSAALAFEYAERLDALLGDSKWGRIMLPASGAAGATAPPVDLS